ncbi:MAG: hypothetical protein F8N36_14480 [Desulfovibrio sp.]|uniref:hypothetical protein n=1 Tax=Desulfovibrio sp. TaxID=885 RepID=UPI00135D62BF|nr:hypothetical protein [Desulfovibrio sp.]MTJ94045.1 hypothetical protein [Desulfovibrio sp.]
MAEIINIADARRKSAKSASDDLPPAGSPPEDDDHPFGDMGACFSASWTLTMLTMIICAVVGGGRVDTRVIAVVIATIFASPAAWYLWKNRGVVVLAFRGHTGNWLCVLAASILMPAILLPSVFRDF